MLRFGEDRDHPLGRLLLFEGGTFASSYRIRDRQILVVNRNFGCGSSREHAPQAIRRRGITCVVGESYSEIFFGNSVAIGMPCVSAAPTDIDRLQTLIERQPAVEIVVDLSTLDVRSGDLRIGIALPAAARDSFLEGTWDATGLLLDRYEDVERTAKKLPYVAGWDAAGVS